MRFLQWRTGRRRIALVVAATAVASLALPVAPAAAVSSTVTLTDVASISVGGRHACALTNAGGVKCWGANDNGQLGDGTQTDRKTPVGVSGLSSGVAAVAAGGGHTCALLTNNTVKCWGANDHGQIGKGSAGSNAAQRTPATVIDATDATLSSVAAVALGGQHSCAVKSTGATFCWGRNDQGQLGVGGVSSRVKAAAVNNAQSGIAAITADGKNTCARTTGATVKCWGLNDHGQLGNGTTVGEDMPIDVPGLANVAQLASGGQHTCARLADSSVKCWGHNDSGQVGNNSIVDRLTPTNVSGMGSNATAVEAGGRHSCAIQNGALLCWGSDSSGQLGDGTLTNRRVPTSVVGLSAGVDQVSAGVESTCALTAADEVLCWGANDEGQLGDGTTSDRGGPYIPSAPKTVTATAGNGRATIAWSLPENNGGSAVTQYVVTSSGGIAKTVAASSRSTVFYGLTNGVAYTFRVTTKTALGTSTPSDPSNRITPAAPKPPSTAGGPPPGYWMVGAFGDVYGFGASKDYGGGGQADIVDIEPTPTNRGYWTVSNSGQVFAYGDAVHIGNATPSQLRAGELVSSISRTPTGRGYWLFTSRGKVLRFGDAKFYGDMRDVALNGPVLGSVPTPSGRGYYMVASDGGIFTFGDARFYGSMGGRPLNKPVQGLVPTSDNRGYWLVASDGGIFAFGNARFRGSMGGQPLNKPVIGMVRYGTGYLMVASDGGIFNFSSQPFLGSLGANPPLAPIRSVASTS